MVERKYIKMGVAGLAALAIIIGVSVGVTQSQKRNASASQAYGYGDMAAVDECEEIGSISHSKAAKASDSMSYSAKSGKGSKSGSMPSDVEEAGDTGDYYRRERRRLVVPGTEEYAAGVESGKRAQLRNEQQRRLGRTDIEEGGDGGYDYGYAESTASMSLSSKGSKGSGSKSGKGEMSYDYSSKGGKSSSKGDKSCEADIPSLGDVCGKAGKSSGGKSGKGMSYDGSTPGPTVCGTPSPTGAKSVKSAKSTPSPTPPAPTCDCEDNERGWFLIDGQCIKPKCGVTCDNYGVVGSCEPKVDQGDCCRATGGDDTTTCGIGECETPEPPTTCDNPVIFFLPEGSGGPLCVFADNPTGVFDEYVELTGEPGSCCTENFEPGFCEYSERCPLVPVPDDRIETPEPTPFPITPDPTFGEVIVTAVPTDLPTPAPSSGSTPTVGTDAASDPTMPPREIRAV